MSPREKSSFSDENCGTFFQERRDSLFLVGGDAEAAKDARLKGESFVQREICALTHGFDTGGDG